MVLTNIARTCMPLVRYRTGDIAALYKSECGSHLDVLGHIVRRREGAYLCGGRELFPALFDETLFREKQLLDYRIFADGERLVFDVEVLDPETFCPEALAEELGALDCLKGWKRPLVRPLPCGALRPFAFEKKRILPLEEREHE